MKSEHLVGTSIPRFTYDTPTVPGNDFYALCEGEQKCRSHGAGSDAAGVKRDGRERARHEKAHSQRNKLAGHEEIHDRNACDDTQHRKPARGGDRDG